MFLEIDEKQFFIRVQRCVQSCWKTSENKNFIFVRRRTEKHM